MHPNPFDFLLEEQQQEYLDLVERAQHSDTMRFTALDAETLDGYEKHMARIEAELEKEYEDV